MLTQLPNDSRSDVGKGSVQGIKDIPNHIKEIYKTVWEINPRTLIDMAVDRAPYICQSQSLSIYMETPTIDKLVSSHLFSRPSFAEPLQSKMHMYGWKRGLKMGMYYLRCRASSQPLPVTLPVSMHSDNTQSHTSPTTEQIAESNDCTSCSA